MTGFSTVLFDVDGTLVDSNDAHARAWIDAFAEAGVRVDAQAVRRAIGMGGDKLMPAVSGLAESTPEGERISTRRRAIFMERYLRHVRPFPGAADLVAAIKARGATTVAASSAKADELQALLRLAGVERLLDAATSSDDAGQSKPDPDIVAAALRRARARPEEAVLIGDTPYDLEAAARTRVAAVAVRCGGWGDADLRGAILICDGPWDLRERLNEARIGVRSNPGV